jgi:hypothetical protein
LLDYFLKRIIAALKPSEIYSKRMASGKNSNATLGDFVFFPQ